MSFHLIEEEEEHHQRPLFLPTLSSYFDECLCLHHFGDNKRHIRAHRPTEGSDVDLARFREGNGYFDTVSRVCLCVWSLWQ